MDVADDVKRVAKLDLLPFSVTARGLARFSASLDARAGVDLVPLLFRIDFEWTVNLREEG